MPRLRDLGLSLGDLPTALWNAVIDVPGVCVGYAAAIQGDGPLRPGGGPVRAGVADILPPNALLTAQTMTGRHGHVGHALPIDQLLQLLALSPSLPHHPSASPPAAHF